MKPWQFLSLKKYKAFYKKLNQRGQTIVEFVLLLLVLTTVSYGFVAFMNARLAFFWEFAVNLVVYDKPSKQIKIKE